MGYGVARGRTGKSRSEVVRALQVLWVVPEPLAAIVRLEEPTGLDHGPHRAVDHGDALFQERAQAGFGGHARLAH